MKKVDLKKLFQERKDNCPSNHFQVCRATDKPCEFKYCHLIYWISEYNKWKIYE